MIAVSPSSKSSVATPMNITVSCFFPASAFGAGASIQSLKSSRPAAAQPPAINKPPSNRNMCRIMSLSTAKGTLHFMANLAWPHYDAAHA
jgi:hypothetical protein